LYHIAETDKLSKTNDNKKNKGLIMFDIPSPPPMIYLQWESDDPYAATWARDRVSRDDVPYRLADVLSWYAVNEYRLLDGSVIGSKSKEHYVLRKVYYDDDDARWHILRSDKPYPATPEFALGKNLAWFSYPFKGQRKKQNALECAFGIPEEALLCWQRYCEKVNPDLIDTEIPF